jgi:hypothetical protein
MKLEVDGRAVEGGGVNGIEKVYQFPLLSDLEGVRGVRLPNGLAGRGQ